MVLRIGNGSCGSLLLHPHQFSDWWSKHHQLLVLVEKKTQAREIAIFLIWQRLRF